MNKPQISFDEHGRVRVLEADKFQKTQALQTECNNFVRRITEFGGKVESVVKVLDAYSQRIEAEKMKAIGCVVGVGEGLVQVLSASLRSLLSCGRSCSTTSFPSLDLFLCF